MVLLPLGRPSVGPADSEPPAGTFVLKSYLKAGQECRPGISENLHAEHAFQEITKHQPGYFKKSPYEETVFGSNVVPATSQRSGRARPRGHCRRLPCWWGSRPSEIGDTLCPFRQQHVLGSRSVTEFRGASLETQAPPSTCEPTLHAARAASVPFLPSWASTTTPGPTRRLRIGLGHVWLGRSRGLGSCAPLGPLRHTQLPLSATTQMPSPSGWCLDAPPDGAQGQPHTRLPSQLPVATPPWTSAHGPPEPQHPHITGAETQTRTEFQLWPQHRIEVPITLRSGMDGGL